MTGSMARVQEMVQLTGRVAFVSGAAMGIGRGIAERLAEAGATVALADVNDEKRTETVDQLSRAGYRVLGVPLDVSDPAACRRAVVSTSEEFKRLDILVNNAGIFPFAPVSRITPELWNRVLAVNLSGSFYLAQAAAEVMKRTQGGSIVNIGSVDSVHPSGQLVHYDASKGGVRMLTRALALELAPHHIRVNAVLPGGVNTPGAAAAATSAMQGSGGSAEDFAKAFLSRIPMGRMAEPDDIARAVLFFASPLSEYVTGAELAVDGGYLIS
jgi:2-dehydro-3-deoxy-D-gluconate 5-dehydrogenase